MIEDKTEKATTFLSKFLMIAPLIAAIVFTILFTTLLHGRLEERISHALIVFMLWMYATSFYVDILKHYSRINILISSAIGNIISVIFAIILTPLDRYRTLVYSYSHRYTFVLGFCMLAIFYMGFIVKKKKIGVKNVN